MTTSEWDDGQPMPEDEASAKPARVWAVPMPIGRDAAPPDFPIDVLPRWVASFVDAEAEAVQVPIDMPAMFALGALAAVIGGRVRVRAWEGFEEACNLYTCVAMPPAAVKSPVHRHVTAPITRFEEELQARAAPQVAAAMSRRKVLEKRLARAEDHASKAPELARKQAMLEVDMAREDLDREKRVVLPRLIVDDCTPEQLKSLLAEHSGRLAMMSAESAFFGNVASSRYSKNPNIEAALAGHSGDDLRVDRRERVEVIKDPRLTICIAVQPAVLRQAYENVMARERGLFARFLYSLPPSNVGYRDLSALPPEVPGFVREQWDLRLRSIAHAMAGLQEPLVLPLSSDARGAFQLWRARHEPKLRPDGELVSIDSWAAKLPGHVLRLAGILAVSGEEPRSEIPPHCIENAIDLAAYFTAHAQIAFDAMSDDSASADARRVLTWAKARGKPSFTRAELTVAFKGRLSSSALEPVVMLLVSLGWLSERTQGTKGRPKKVFEVNPSLGSLVLLG